MALDHIPSSPLTIEQLFDHVQVQERAPAIARLYHVDARCRIRLRSAYELALPMSIDTWRRHGAMDILFARGVWPVLSYYDMQLSATAVAPGYVSEVTGGLCLGRMPERTLAGATEVNVYGFRGSGPGEKLRERVSEEQEIVATLRVMSGLIQPFKPNEFVLREVPEELAKLEVRESRTAPSIAELSERDSDLEPVGVAFEYPFVWALHQTDAMSLIYSTEYLYTAEDQLARALHAADLPLMAFRAARVRTVYKRPFLAGQSCLLRCSLFVRKRDRAVLALVGFHAVDRPGVVQETPAVLARFDGAFDAA